MAISFSPVHDGYQIGDAGDATDMADLQHRMAVMNYPVEPFFNFFTASHHSPAVPAPDRWFIPADLFFWYQDQHQNPAMLPGDADSTMHHTAKFSAAFLQPRYPEPCSSPEDTRWVIVRENGVYVMHGTPPALFFPDDLKNECPRILGTEYLGHRDSLAYYAAETASGPACCGCTFYPNVRELYGVLPDDELALAALAVQMIDFDRTTRFCGRCGSPTRPSLRERARICDACSLTMYPRISPAIIVLVRRGDTVLLARSPRFPGGLHSIIAGFVEPGETLEEAIHREVREETGIEITGIRYMGSEPWPFPDSLMIGFIADYAGGEIVVDSAEIVSAGWFSRNHLPPLPPALSISRALVDWWISSADKTRI